MPGPAARAAVKARGLRTEGFGQLLHAELAPGRVARPPGRRRGLSRQVAAVGGPSRAAGGPGLAVARPDRADGGLVARRSPGADVEQRRQVLGRLRGPRREGQRGGCGRGKTLVEVLRGRICGDRAGQSGAGSGRGRRGLRASGAGQGGDWLPETRLSTPRALDPARGRSQAARSGHGAI